MARLVNSPSLLPTVFYTCALLGGSILDGHERDDKSVEHLSHQDIKRRIDGRNKLAEEAFAIILEVFAASPCGGCRTSSSCWAALQRMLEKAVNACRKSSALVLQGWVNVVQKWAKEVRLYDFCEKAVIEREYKARKRVWDALPTIFDVEVDEWEVSASGGDTGGIASAATT